MALRPAPQRGSWEGILTNPTADAAKLLAQAQYQGRKPGDPIERPILYFDEAGYREGPAIMWINPYSGEAEAVCAFFWPSHPLEETDAVEILWEDFGNSFVASWNTRPQPAPPSTETHPMTVHLSGPDPYGVKSTAPPAGELKLPDWPKRDGFCPVCNGNDYDVPCAYSTERPTGCWRAYRLGLAARPKVEDAEVLHGQLAEITADRDEWKQQHENLVSVRQTDIANLAAKIDDLKQELDRRKGDPRTRLHNLCEALQEDLDKSPYTREEWEQVDREIVELQRKLREAEANLAEREAELAKADAVIAEYVALDVIFDAEKEPTMKSLDNQREAQRRHAARQQQRASAEPTASKAGETR